MDLERMLVEEIETGIPPISVEDACKRDDLSQKHLLGMCLRNRYDDPIFAHTTKPTAEQLKNPGKLLLLDNWQLRKYVYRHRPLHKS